VTRRLLRAALVTGCALGLSIVVPAERCAHAGGLDYANRGVRPLARGGAFVAGADDLGAVYYNPAGIIDAGSSILFDASWVNFSSDYTRQASVRQVDPNTGETVRRYERTFPTVEGSTPFLPIPTVVGSWAFHPDFVVAAGIATPYAALTSYPEEVEGQPAPQRYSLYSLDGSALVVAGIWAAWAPIDQLRIGGGFNMLLGNFNTTLAFSGCLPDRFFCSPENPYWDVNGELAVGPIVSPSGSAGAIWEFLPGWRFGASFNGPFAIDAPATLKTRLPSAPPFAEAEQENDTARVQFDLPWQLRFGVENRSLIENLRVEVAFDYQAWSMHDEISVDPDGISLNNVATFPPKYYIPSVTLERGFQDTFGLHLGGEYTVKASKELAVDLRAGVSYESSGIEPAYLSVTTIDSDKVTPAIGAGLHVGEKLRFDFVFAYVIASTVTVSPDEAKIAQVVPVTANPVEEKDIVNAGIYESRATVLGLGVVYTFDRPRQKKDEGKEEIPETPKPAKPAAEPDPKPDPEPEPKAEEAASMPRYAVSF
jgi:long-chain fatty acid transport protein